jgi:tetratricopeptide (TPR) repeat protein/serine/threonine protein kinase
MSAQRARALFVELVSSVPAEQWDARLAEPAGEDAALRARVAALLAAHRQADSFLEYPAGPPGATVDPDPPARHEPAPEAAHGEGLGAVLAGRYKLVEAIGEGGMGTVYLAQQTEPVKRLVALKVIKPGMDSRQVIARFEAERQALALMDHPNIARVLDAGTTESGRPYFVMELVKGVPLTKYCDEHRLTPRQRLELFVPVCQAIQHAHQKGIIHRDIKPSNVLVCLYDGRPVPKVIDFGIAKATGQQLTDHTLVTGFGMVVGTLEYMSPEQAERNQLDIDTRSDIYSLGVLLYELLTGTTPLDRKRLKEAAVLELLRIIREEEPPRPSTRLSESKDSLPSISAQRQMEPAKLTRLVRGELDWIVMKALDKDRNRRYETANGFALDVQRYLADEPVQACPPSAWYRFRKFTHRNKPALTVAGVIFFLIALSGAGGGWVLRDREAREQEVARDREAREKEIARERATRSAAIDGEANLALAEADRFQDQGKWPQALSAAKRAHGFVAGGEGSAAVRTRVQDRLADLEMAVRLVEVPALMRSAAAPGTKFNYPVGDKAYAEAFRSFGVNVEALGVQEAGDRLRGRSIRVELATALEDWASIRRTFTNDRDTSWHLLQVAQATDPKPWRKPLWEVLAPADGKPERARLEALARSAEALALPPVALHQLAKGLVDIGARDEGIALLRRAWRRYPGDFRINQDLVDYLSVSNPDEALRYSTAAVALSPRRRAVWAGFASLHVVKGLLNEARAAYLEAQRLDPDSYSDFLETIRNARKKLGDLDRQITDCRKAVALHPHDPEAHYNLGEALHAQGNLAGAVAAYRKAIEVSPEFLPAHLGLADALQARGDLHAAIQAYSEVLKRLPNSSEFLRRRADAYRRTKQWDEAIADYRKAIELKSTGDYFGLGYLGLGRAALRLSTDDPKDDLAAARKTVELYPQNSVARVDLGRLLLKTDRAGALTAFRKAVELDPLDVQAHYLLGLTLLHAPGKRSKAELEEAAAAAYSQVIKLQPDNSNYWFYRGLAYEKLGQLGKARDDFSRAILLHPILLHQGKLDALLGRARVCAELGQWEAAIADYETLMKVTGRGPIYPAQAHNNLAWLLATCPDAKYRDPARAIQLARKAIELWPEGGPLMFSATLGVAYYRHGNDKLAIAAMSQSRSPRVEEWLFLAMAHHNLGAHEEARKWYDKAVAYLERYSSALETNSRDADQLRRFRAEAEQRLGLDRQLADCRKAVALHPHDPEAHYNLGEALHARGYLNEAIQEYSEALKRVPNSSDVFRRRADARRRNRQWDEAITDYRKAIELKSANSSSYLGSLGYLGLGRAALSLSTDDPKDDVVAARKAVELYPQNSSAHFALGRALVNTDRAGALTALRKAVEVDPKDALAHVWLGQTLLAATNPTKAEVEQAAAAYSHAIQLQPDNNGAWFNRGLAHQRLGQWEKARNNYSRAILLAEGRHLYALEGRAVVCAAMGEYKAAIADYETLMKLNDRVPAALAGAHNGLAWLLATCPDAKYRDPARAIQLARKAIELMPGRGPFGYSTTLGVAYYRFGDDKAAITALSQSRSPGAVEWLFLAMAHENLGAHEEGRKWYGYAVAWLEQSGKALETNPLRAAELRRFRDEAEQRLGLKKK